MAAAEHANRLIGMITDGCLDWETVARECIARMSEDEVDDMIRECDWDYDGDSCG